MLTPQLVVVDLLVTCLLSTAGVLGAWLLRRHTMLSVRNLYLLAGGLGSLVVSALAIRWWAGVLVTLPLSAPAVAGSVTGRRWRLSDLGAGEELRQHELARRWIWQPTVPLPAGERRYVGAQSEIVRIRPWPPEVAYVSMTADTGTGPRLPLGEGQHIFECGGTGTGKTTTARRPLAARTLTHHAAALLIDQKGDPDDERELRKLAAAADRAFILFDPRDPERSDRWAPLWGEPGAVAARAVEAIKTSEPYYADVLRQHLNLIVAVLHAAGRWPPSFPFLVSASSASSYATIRKIAAGLDPARFTSLKRRVEDHADWVESREGAKDLRGGLIRLEVVMGAAWRDVLTPRFVADGQAVAVRLIEALRAGAVVMWRTYADDMPDEAAAITVLALADLHAAAGHANAPWTLMLDEFGAVIHMAAARGVSILQRARSHGGQVIVISQSAADIDALSQQPGLLPSLADNFTAFVAHRQTAPETRDWLAKLMGTRALWQSTDQTTGHGAGMTGQGSRRRVREFRIGSDEFATLGRGEAVIYTTLGPEPQRANIAPVRLPEREPERIGLKTAHACEIALHSEQTISSQPLAASDADRPDDDHGPHSIDIGDA